MEKNYKIEDLYLLDLRARQRGLKVEDYIATAQNLKVNLDELIEIEKSGKDLKEIMQKKKSLKTRRKVVIGVLTTATAYLLNLGVMLGVDRIQTSESYNERKAEVGRVKDELKDIITTYYNLPEDSKDKGLVFSNGFSLYHNNEIRLIKHDAEMWKRDKRIAKAINPLKHFL